ncbi:TonB-dependent receptor plug domain-containing protein [Massilia sp. CCM 8733]|uniref:TonB-dependent receptor plug domain-containing protein n=1 Tax=Massilia mucilaginosa TaxID=2609282 RepID=A0ABX0NQU0_9BURK|nr:TonB-dependent receptor [Massilia mucilaginosa]NHZ89192.1 TonB-dependent receptor plug domain-containing protein [Massilia mucilaginosa]
MTPTPNPPLRAVALAAALASLASPAVAEPDYQQDLNALPIEQLLNLEIITASKFAQKISEAPSSVSVITADDIRRFGYRSLADILRSVRGVYVTDDRNYSYVGTRGSGRPGDFNTRLLILVDGRRLNDMVYDQGAVGTEFPIDVSLVERVEFVPGPGSAMYGSSAFFGVVNVITKTGAALQGTTLAASAASAATRKARIATGFGYTNGLDLLLGASWLERKGGDQYFPEYDDGAPNFGVARQLDHDLYKRAFARLSWGGFSASAYAGRRTKGIPTASYGQQFNDPRSQTSDEYVSASAAWQAALSPTLEVHAGVNLRNYRYQGTYIYVADSATVNIDAAESRTVSTELRLLSTAFRNHKIIAGAEYASDHKRTMINYDLAPYASYLLSERPKKRAGLYVQDEFRLGERLILNAGLRHDHDDEGGGNSNPRLALIYKAAAHSTLKALYGTAFRSPNSYERHYATSTGYKLNPGLKPERIQTYELIGEYFPSENFRATASLFQYRLTDLVALTTDPLDSRLFHSNIDSARSKGAEFEAEWLRNDGSSLKTSISLQYAHNGTSGEWLSNSPRQLFKLNYAKPLWGDTLRAALECQFTSRRRTTAGGQVGGFGLVNLTVLSGALGKHVELSASIYNLLGKHYADSASEEHYDSGSPARYLNAIAQDGRSWRIQASYTFR